MANWKNARDPILLVHGIESDGEWYAFCARVASPFASPISARYGGYKGRTAWLKVALGESSWRWSALAVLTISVGALLLGAETAIGASCAVAVTVALVAARYFVQRRYREPALEAIGQVLRESCAVEPPPHLLAHSFGTYLSTTVHVRASQRLSRVILTGSVVRHDFSWASAIKRRAVHEVWNEVHEHDVICRFAGVAGGNIGASGVRGFVDEPKGSVHTFLSEQGDCPSCSAVEAKVHNVVRPSGEHSDYFLSPAFATDSLVPILLGLPRAEHVKLRRESVALLSSVASENDAVRNRRVLSWIRKGRWAWASDHTIAQAMTQHLTGTTKGQVDEAVLVAWAMRFCYAMEEAIRALESIARNATFEHESLNELARRADPRYALFVTRPRK